MTQAFNLAQLANNLNTSGQLDATDGLNGLVANANLASSGTASSSTFLRGDRTWATVTQKVLQVINASTSTQASTTSTSFVSTGFSASITPSSTSSKILIFFTANGYQTASAYDVFTIYRGGTNIGGSTWGFGALYGNTGDRFGQVSGNYLDSPSTTSSVTYTIYYRATASTSWFNLNGGAGGELSTMTLMEISA